MPIHGAEVKLVQSSISFITKITLFCGKDESELNTANRKKDLLVNINRAIRNIGMIEEVKDVPVVTSLTESSL